MIVEPVVMRLVVFFLPWLLQLAIPAAGNRKKKKNTGAGAGDLPEQIQSLDDAQQFLSMAGQAHTRGDAADALRVLTRAIQLAPTFAQFYAVRGAIQAGAATTAAEYEVRAAEYEVRASRAAVRAVNRNVHLRCCCANHVCIIHSSFVHSFIHSSSPP